MHDFKKFPELTNTQMAFYYHESPHRQATEDFTAEVVNVHDGDTVTLRWDERNFTFPLRIVNISARELKETQKRDTSGQNSAPGSSSKAWLENMLLRQTVTIRIDETKRVDKWGRLLGRIELGGQDVGEQSILAGMSVAWENRNDGAIPSLDNLMSAVSGAAR